MGGLQLRVDRAAFPTGTVPQMAQRVLPAIILCMVGLQAPRCS
jgi:hypothetical protein